MFSVSECVNNNCYYFFINCQTIGTSFCHLGQFRIYEFVVFLKKLKQTNKVTLNDSQNGSKCSLFHRTLQNI